MRIAINNLETSILGENEGGANKENYAQGYLKEYIKGVSFGGKHTKARNYN
jgi:hypothetical protein